LDNGPAKGQGCKLSALNEIISEKIEACCQENPSNGVRGEGKTLIASQKTFVYLAAV